MHALSRRSFTVALRSATCYRSSSYSAAVISSPLIVSQPCDDKQFAHGDQIQQFVRSYSQIASVPMYKWQVEVDNDMAEAKRYNKSEVLSKECPADVAASAQISNRARFLPSVLATGIFSWSANMERPMMARTVEDASSQQIKRSSIVFLISPDNPIITNLNAALPVDKSARGLVDLQYDVASLGGVAGVENDNKIRWYSAVTAGRGNTARSAALFNLCSGGLSFGTRYESTSAASAEPPAEKFEYQAEVSRLMDLIVNSLYSNKEVFLRELISNASDALDKLRYLSVTQAELMKDAVDLDIRIQADKDNGIITITDTGIGMTRQELIDCLGTIAQSGTAKFLKAIKESKDAGADSNLIGQFGVGFYSAFLVSEKVEVSTKSPKSDKQFVWEGEANASSYVIREETDPEKLIPRGTRLTLYLKCDDKQFAHPERIQKLVKNYSQFVSFPIYTWQEKGYTKEVEVDEDPAEAKKDDQDQTEKKKKKTKTVVEKYWDWELTNETQPIWLRNPREVTKEEYNEFYKNTFNEYLDPLASSHFTTEGEVEFRSILYVPAVSPTGKEDIANPKTKNIRLYVKRVFISDDFDGELFPRYLSFVKGVLDSNDLPLNVSREILQESRIVRIMRKRLVRKAFDMFLGISMSENREDYERFWDNFGKHLKLGCIEDRENHKRIAPLLRFFSSQSENEMISLDEYVENMKPEQKDIFFIAADSVTSAKNTPFLEKLLEKDLEVLFLVDPIDEVAIQSLKSYKDKNFIDITKEDLDIGDKNEEKEKEVKQEFGQTCDWIKKRLGDKVAGVHISNRLSASPCVLATGKFGWSANMERLMKAQTVGDTSSLEFMRSRRIFEINPDHPIIRNLNAAIRNNPDDEDALKAVDLLYDAALVSSGFTPENPAQLGGKIYEMMNMALSGKWASPLDQQHAAAQPQHQQTLEAEVIEPAEAGGQK